MLNKDQLLTELVKSIKSKHPWKISEDKYSLCFGELPQEFLEERIHFENLRSKTHKFKRCSIYLENIEIQIQLNIDELIEWELQLDKCKDEVNFHKIYPSDIKKLLKDSE